MPRLTKIYTKTGDDGTTGLVGGARVRKDDLRVEAYGTVDETNAALGVAICACEAANNPALQALAETLRSLQHDCFDLGADLATPITTDEQDPQVAAMRLRIVQHQVDRLERLIDQHNEPLGALTNFVLPGGSPAAAALHLARTISRRAERIAVSLMLATNPAQHKTPQASPAAVNPLAIIYLNRLSDLLFVLARVANTPATNGKGDVLWLPGKSRGQ